MARAKNAGIMILGETGVGKTRLARHIHQNSPRRDAPFVLVDLSQATESVFTAELFGHEQGSFTDAKRTRRSPLEAANGGTVFLDEIGTLSFDLQAKLLRLVQDKRFKRVGGGDDIELDVRFIAATSLNLREKVARGEFREDLYYRLATLSIEVPPLRDRQNDILPLADHFLRAASEKEGIALAELTEAARQALLSYGWPGNVRELENAVTRGLVMADGGRISSDDLELMDVKIVGSAKEEIARDDAEIGIDYSRWVEEISIGRVFNEIETLCVDIKRHLIWIALQDSARKNGREQIDTSDFKTAAQTLRTAVGHLCQASRGLFFSNSTRQDDILKKIAPWKGGFEGDRDPSDGFKIAQSIFSEREGFSGRRSLIGFVEDILIAEAKKSRCKTALLKYGLNHRRACQEIGVAQQYVSRTVASDPEFREWLSRQKYREDINRSLSGVNEDSRASPSYRSVCPCGTRIVREP